MTPTSYNPVLLVNLCEGLLNSIVTHTLMSIKHYESGKWVFSGKQNWMLTGERNVSIL